MAVATRSGAGALGRKGGKAIRMAHRDRFFARKHGSARVPLALGAAPHLGVAGKVYLNLAFLQLGFLQGEDVDIKLACNLVEARVLFEHGAQTVDVPRGK